MRTTTNIILIIILFSIIAFTQIDLNLALAAYNTTDVDVNVSSYSQITLLPNYINWTQLVAGSIGGYKNITVKNTGSVNVSSIYGWVNTLDREQARPYGSSNATLYAAGGVLTIRNETDTKYYYMGRIEWNWTQDIPNHVWTAVTTPTSWGYFRNLTDSYVWVLGNGTDGYCNNTGAQFSIETDADLGTAATRTPDNTVTLYPSTNDAEHWSTGNITASTLTGHCVAAYYDCSKIYIYKYDKRDNFTDCSNDNYLYNGQLTPAGTFILKIDAWVPLGIPAGDLNRSTITVAGS